MRLKHILVATDFSEPSRVALEHGKDLARSHGATLHVLHVVEQTPTYYGSGVGLAVADIEEKIAAAAERRLEAEVGGGDDGVVVRTWAARAPKVADAVNEYAAANDVDLIVIGTHGRGAVSRFLMGSVTERIVRSASRPVLTVQAHAGEAPLDATEVGAHETAAGAAV
jgi:nucleotide-binding universal stress UspA family protein